MPPVPISGRPRIGFVWAQFGPYHTHRLAAVARRLAGRAQLVAVELVSRSGHYDWSPAQQIPGIDSRTLFQDRPYDSLTRREIYGAVVESLEDCDIVVIGLSSSEPENAAMAIRLRRGGAQVFFCSDSKADDHKRPRWREWAKRGLLKSYNGGIIAGRRSRDYYRSLGIAAEKLHPGYDTVDTELLAGKAGARGAQVPFARRPFLFLGRFIWEKNLPAMLEGYARYRTKAGSQPRELVMAGAGPLEDSLKQQARELGIADAIQWTGFLDIAASMRELDRALALLLVSVSETWGLVVNEAMALGRPVIASERIGACDLLVRHEETGLIVPHPARPKAIAEAMLAMGADEQRWHAMCAAARDTAWLGDVERFADTIELLVDPHAQPARTDQGRLLAQFDPERG